MTRYFTAWVNEAALKYGGKSIDGPSTANQIMGAIWSKARYGTNLFKTAPQIPGLQSSGAQVWQDIGLTEKRALDLMYNDFW
ncbi:hypothetical protein VKT23_018370 [Stygiomarasmius scandens]|uniref:Uncharacterized protein n=1 Tax=Marasmiellus scandens TaxID=2682957 RepID=A0ABR1IPH5_9AGAR